MNSLSTQSLLKGLYAYSLPKINTALLQKANPNVIDCNGLSALLIACGYTDTTARYNAIYALLRAGANDTYIPPFGITALMLLARLGDFKCCQLLFKRRTLINYRGCAGNTALMCAIKSECYNSSHDSIIKLMLDNGANISLTDNYNNTPLKKALDLNRHIAITLLSEHAPMTKFNLVA